MKDQRGSGGLYSGAVSAINARYALHIAYSRKEMLIGYFIHERDIWWWRHILSKTGNRHFKNIKRAKNTSIAVA